ncbi:MAG TPA: asparagine synthase-related protein [Candidatus Eisenbacteria bacterium]|nr:asparagine synthase-related protein [Candidatus Eisenbacteria bacterium]
MGGIYGYIFKHPVTPRSNPDALDRMDAALQSNPSATAPPRSIQLGNVALGATGAPHRQSAAIRGEGPLASTGIAFYGNLCEIGGVNVTARGHSEIAHLLLSRFAEKGKAFLEGLRGEFVLALCDSSSGECLLAVDLLRVHPLLVYEDRDRLVFASRMNALAASGLVQTRTLAPESLIDVVAGSMIPSPKTVHREIQKLPPGHALSHRDGTTIVGSYADLRYDVGDSADPAALAGRLKELVRESIALRLPAEADPRIVGVFLSGGLDSSTVAGVLSGLRDRPTRSFTIGFDEEHFNELEYARIAATAFGTEHHEYVVTPSDTLDAIPKLLDWFDEPYANASAVPTYYCARLAREHGVEVLLAGDGGDELFAGNPWYGTRQLFDYYRMLPRWMGDGVLRPTLRAAARTGIPLFRKAARYAERARLSYPDRLATYGIFQLLPLEHLFTPEFLHSLPEPYLPFHATRRLYAAAPARAELDRQLYVDLKLVIGDNDLLKVGRMTEAAGVAVHFPLLDPVLAQFAAGIPAKVKMPGTELRSFFKRAYADLLPPETLKKRKHGFGLPIPLWLKTDTGLHDLMRELLTGRPTVERGIFRPAAIEDLIRRHESDSTHYYGAVIWNLMVIELWLRKHA